LNLYILLFPLIEPKKKQMKKLEEIEIEIIPKLFTTFLLNKFRYFKIKTLGDILNLKIDDFSKIEGIGVICVSQLYALKQYIRTNPDKYLDYYNGIVKDRPDQEIEHDKTILSPILLDESILESINLISSKKYRMILFYSFGLNGSMVYKSEEIGLFSGISSESVWQIKIKLVKQIANQLKKELQINPHTNNPLAKLFKKLTDILNTSEMLNFQKLNSILSADFNYVVNSRNDGTMQFVLFLLGLEFDNTNKCIYTKTEHFYRNRKQWKELFVGNQMTTDTQNYIASSIDQENAIIDIIRKKRHLKGRETKDGLPETENQTLDNMSFNQVDFELLTMENRVYQILKAKGEPMHITEINSELNRLLLNSNSTAVYQKSHLDLTADDRFICNYNIGYYELAEWDLVADIVNDVVESEIIRPPHPRVYLEILNRIKKEETESDNKTIVGLISLKCFNSKTGSE